MVDCEAPTIIFCESWDKNWVRKIFNSEVQFEFPLLQPNDHYQPIIFIDHLDDEQYVTAQSRQCSVTFSHAVDIPMVFCSLCYTLPASFVYVDVMLMQGRR